MRACHRVFLPWVPLWVVALVALSTAGCATVSHSSIDSHSASTSSSANTVTVGVIAAGAAHETPFYIHDSGVDGPTVVVVGGVHGNEPAGAIAADQIRQWTIRRGRLVVVPRANPPALAAGTRRTPGKPPELGDLNRNFPAAIVDEDGGDPDLVSVPRGAIAPTLWTFVVDRRPDWLLDLHEGFAIHRINPESVGSSIIHLDEPWITAYAERMLAAVNEEIEDPRRDFVSLGRRGPINTSLARATAAHLDAVGMTLETTWRDQPISLRVRQHRRMVHRLLADLGMVGECASAHAPAMPALSVMSAALVRWREPLTSSADSERAVRVAVYEGPGANADGIERVARIVASMPDAIVTHLSPADIGDGALTNFDVAVFTGGRGGAQGEALGASGREAVRRFVARGGGYIGICAGAYLATSRSDSYLSLIDAHHRRPWQTGLGPVEIELTARGAEILDALPEQRRLRIDFAHGPILVAEDEPHMRHGAFETVATFRTGVTRAGVEQSFMVGTPAIVAAQHGAGRIVLIAPHPEAHTEHAWLVENAIRWAARGATRGTAPGTARRIARQDRDTVQDRGRQAVAASSPK